MKSSGQVGQADRRTGGQVGQVGQADKSNSEIAKSEIIINYPLSIIHCQLPIHPASSITRKRG
jgi:hypothetical protein